MKVKVYVEANLSLHVFLTYTYMIYIIKKFTEE